MYERCLLIDLGKGEAMQQYWIRHKKRLSDFILIIAAVAFYGAIPLFYGFGLYQIIGRVEGVSEPIRWSVALIISSLIAFYILFGKHPDRIAVFYLPGILLFLLGLSVKSLQDTGFF